MLYGYFYSSQFIGGEVKIVSRFSLLFPLFFGNCPKCSKGKVFKGIVALNRNCKECKIYFNINKIDDTAIWITTFFLSILSVPIACFTDYTFQFSFPELVFYMALIILLLTILLLGASKYILIINLIKLELDERK